MPIARKVAESQRRASWIRRMFEEGARLKARLGEDAVVDLTLGNPDLEPPPRFREVLQGLVAAPPAGHHRYMPNGGFPAVREAVAGHYRARTGLPVAAEHVVMVVGAGGGLNCVFKALLDPGDEVIVAVPYFPEYLFYIDNHGGVPRLVETRPDFRLDIEAIDAAIGPRTKVVLYNSPNNPTGIIYAAEDLAALAETVRAAEARVGHPIFLLSDEPYRNLVYEGNPCPETLPIHANAIVVTSRSKDLGLAGERIGHVVVHPGATDVAELCAALVFVNRTLGYVNAPALMQRASAACLDLSLDPAPYRRRRDILLDGLSSAGYECVSPSAGFYAFPRAPIEDDVRFVETLAAEGVLVVPGSGFGRAGHFRVAFCVPDEAVARSLPAFVRVAERLRG